MWTFKQINTERPGFPMGRGITKAFEDTMKAIANTTVVTFNDLEKPVTIQTDISDVGVEAVLLQNGKPVSYASRVWNDYEKYYSPIKKEVRAAMFGLLPRKICNNRVRSQNIKSNQQQAYKRSTKKTVKNDAFVQKSLLIY